MRNELKCEVEKDGGNSSVEIYKEEAFEDRGKIFADVENNVYRDG